MKKTLLFIMALLLSVGVKAKQTIVYQGEFATGKWASSLSIDKSAFANMTEGDILYVCTRQGLYSKDLSDSNSIWQFVGFEGISLQDYARNGDDMLALRHRYYNNNNCNEILFLSHDEGKTHEDITPESFKTRNNTHYIYTFLTLEQHPTDPSTLLTSFDMFQTADFGKTWHKLTNMTPEYMGYHPLNPDIIYEAGGGEHTDDQTDFRISSDGGQTWQNKTYKKWLSEGKDAIK